MNAEQSTFIDPAEQLQSALQLVPPNLQRQPEKPLTGLCTFLRITSLCEDHPNLTYFPVNIPLLKGPTLWRAMLRHCSNDKNNGVILTRAKRDRRPGKPQTLLRQVFLSIHFNLSLKVGILEFNIYFYAVIFTPVVWCYEIRGKFTFLGGVVELHLRLTNFYQGVYACSSSRLDERYNFSNHFKF